MNPDRRDAEPGREYARPAVVPDEQRARIEQTGQLIKLNLANEIVHAIPLLDAFHDRTTDRYLVRPADQHDVNVLGCKQLVDQVGKVRRRPQLGLVSGTGVHADPTSVAKVEFRQLCNSRCLQARHSRSGGWRGSAIPAATMASTGSEKIVSRVLALGHKLPFRLRYVQGHIQPRELAAIIGNRQ